jgi:hypothetical protein
MRLVDEGVEKVYGVSMGVAEKKGETKKGKISFARNLPRILRLQWITETFRREQEDVHAGILLP